MVYNKEEKRESEYNELALKMMRINKLQDKINVIWQNPKGYWINPDVCEGGPEVGYVLIAANILSLYSEIRPKCSPDEKKDADKLRDKIFDIIDGQEGIYNSRPQRDKVEYIYSPEKWKILKKMLKQYEDMVRMLLDEHGFSPDKNDVAGL